MGSAVDNSCVYKPSLNDVVEEKLPIYENPKGFGARHTQALILFISLGVGFALRAQLSVTMVAMTNVPKSCQINDSYGGCDLVEVNPSNNLKDNEVSFTNRTEYSSNFNTTILMNRVGVNKSLETKGKWNVYRTYDWSKPTQEIIMYSFFVGYTTMMVPMGLCAQRFGGKIPIMIALFVNGIISFLMPWVPIIGGWTAMSACRLMQGMTQAAFYPSIHTILGKWAPLCERGRLSTYIYTGSQFGTVFIFQISGVLAGSTFGWPSSFWLCSLLSFLSLCLVARFCAATPQDHSSISHEELCYIMGNGTGDAPRKRKTPWLKILSSKAVWGLITTHCGSAVGYLFVFTEIPLYMNKILGVDIKRNGVYSSLPYIAMYIMTLLFGVLSDYLANNKYISLVNIRRLANTIGMGVAGAFLIAFTFVNSTEAAVVLLILSLGCHSGVHVGFMINHIDLAPNFAGPMMAFGNMLASLSGLGVPLLVSNIVKDVTNQGQWRTVSTIIATIQIATNVVFVILARADVQPWNFVDGEEEDMKYEEMKPLTKVIQTQTQDGKVK